MSNIHILYRYLSGSDATVGFEVQKKPVLEIRQWSCELLPRGFISIMHFLKSNYGSE